MKRLLLVIAPLTLLAGCYKEAKNKLDRLHGVKWNGAYAISAFNADLNLDDAVKLVSKFGNSGAYPDEVIYIAYEETEISKTANEVFVLSDQNANSSSTLTGAEQTALVGSGSAVVNRNFVFPFIIVGIPEIDSIHFSSGNFNLLFQNNYDHGCAGTITIQDLRKTSTIQYTVNVPSRSTFNASELLKDMIIDLTRGGLGFNELRINIDLTYTYSGSAILPGDNFTLNYDFNTMKFSKMFGYFGTFNMLKSLDSMELSIFTDGLKFGSFNFEDPRLKLIYTHNTGIPYRLQTNGLYGYKGGSTTSISGYPANTPIPAVPSSSIGSYFTDSLVVTHPSSNIQTVIDGQPTHILYDFDVIGNPAGPAGRNFVLAESEFKVKVALELPFFGLAGHVELSDTIDFKLGIDNIEKTVDWLNLRFDVTNEIPVTLGFQGYFLDSNGNFLDSLFMPFRSIAPAATIDGSGNVISVSTDMFDVEFAKDKIGRIARARQLMFKAFLHTAEFNSSQIPVKVTRNQHMKIKMGIHVKLSRDEKI